MVATGSGLSALLAAFLFYRSSLPASSHVNSLALQPEAHQSSPQPDLGPRHQLTYEQWVDLLKREAKVAAEQRPKHLVILAGDSLSLWFPQELLPSEKTWLNQGISGETSYGLLRRLRLFDDTQPEAIFVMIGINDLIHGVREETLLANQREIVRHLKTVHPQARIVLQSILPHGGSQRLQQQARLAVQEKRQPPLWVDRLSVLPNQSIRKLNQQLAAIARDEKVEYLDMHPDFTDAQGDMLPSLTTDGLHLNRQGYQVWKSHLDSYNTQPPPPNFSFHF
ncbi:lysophospholipase [Leptothermofonsia sichuanensis E412]|nr:lysophospholipase [Leptothermofonsia sichuanensis E412]